MTLEQEVARLRSELEHTRYTIPKVELPCEEIQKLGVRASDRLGYHVLHNHDQLKRALAELEIEILNTAVVEQYMAVTRKMKNGPWYKPNMWSWWEREIRYFRHPIPEFVLNKALQIKDKVGFVSIEVAVLQHDGDSSFFYPDPFLIASLGREKYYVEVWDENIFEGRLTKKA